MIRVLFRILFTLFLFLLGRLLGPRPDGGGRSGPGERGPRPDGFGGSPREGARRAGAKGPPPLDRSDVVDVPFTEIPSPSDPGSGAAGSGPAGSGAAGSGAAGRP